MKLLLLLLSKIWLGILTLGLIVAGFYDPYVLLIPLSAITVWAIGILVDK